jgi:hypothetical protein
MNKKLRITTLFLIIGLIVLSSFSLAKSQPPLPPLVIEGYVTIQTVSGTNITAPAGLTVYTKQQNTTIPNNKGSSPTDAQGFYQISVGNGNNTVPAEGASIDIWVQGTNVTRIKFSYHSNPLDMNLTVIDTTPPAIQVVWPLPGSIVPSSQPLWVNATVTDDLLINETSIAMTLNQTQLTWTYNNATGLLSSQTGPPTPGFYVANITVSDIAGNTANKTWNFTAGNITPPTVTITSPTTANPVYTQSGKPVQVTFTYTEPNPLNWTITISNAAHTVPSVSNTTAITPGTSTATVAVPIDSTAPEGTYNVAVTMYNIYSLSTTTTQINAVVIDNTPPTIGTPTQVPAASNVQPNQAVTVSVSITDTGSGVDNATLSYNTGTATWTDVAMALNTTSGLWQATIPGYPAGTNVNYSITAYDKVGNNAVNNNGGAYFVYTVIPEFPTVTALLMLMTFTAILTVLLKRRKTIKT